MVLSGELYAPAASPQEKNPVPIEYEAGWTREPVWMFWRREQFSCIISGFIAWFGQPIAQLVYQVCCHGSFWSKIRHKCVVPSDWPFGKSKITLTMHNSKYWERSAECCGHKMQYTDSEGSYIMMFSGRKLFCLPLLFLVVRLGTLGYAFTCQFCKKMSAVWWLTVWCFWIYSIPWLLLWNFL
jgi:hypothetical protein